MRELSLLLLVVATCLAGPLPNPGGTTSPTPVTLLNFKNVIYPNGAYKFLYQQSDGSERQEEGQVRNEGLENQYIYVTGYYSYKDSDNGLHRIDYESGIDGFKPDIQDDTKGPGSLNPDLANVILG